MDDPGSQLGGCHNDAKDQYKSLTKHFGFPQENVRILCDDGKCEQPTAHNIRSAIEWLVGNAVAGDLIFFSYSGYAQLEPARPRQLSAPLLLLTRPPNLGQSWVADGGHQ